MMPLVQRDCNICRRTRTRLEYKSKIYQYCSTLCRDKSRLRISQDLKKRFHTLYEIDENGCWIFKKGKSSGGYGCITYKGKQQRAHRVSYLLFNGDIKKGLFVCHSCDRPSCINPTHLWIGTNQDNIKDMFSKNRKSHVGEKNTRAILKEKEVKCIKIQLTNGHKINDIAKKYKVSRPVIEKIKYGYTWKHLDNDSPKGYR